MQKLFEHCFWQNLLMFYNKSGLFIGMRIIYEIRLKFGDKFLTFLTKLVLKGKARICSTIKENLLLYFLSFRNLLSLL